MRASVTAAWPVMCQRFEGRLNCCYLDTKGLVTTGTGNLIDSVAAAQALPWLTKDNQPATPAQIEAEWRQIKARQSIKSQGGYAYVKYATLHLDSATLDSLLLEVTDSFWSHLASTFPNLEAFPADAQLALMDESWQNGKYFLDAGTVWTGTRAAVLAQNWTAAASHVPGTGARADARKRLLNNAAAVVKLGIDPEVLWDTKVPTAPVVPPVVPPPVTPPKDGLMHSSKWNTDYVNWRGGNFVPITRDKLLAIPSNVRVTQGGLSWAPASAMTHAGLGAFDLNTDGMTKAQVWQMGRELLSVNIIPFPRGFTWDSFQGKTISNTNDGNEHMHCIDVDCYDHLHPEAKAQVNEWKRGGDGLVGSAKYYGPGGSLGSWSKSPWNPVNIQKAKDAAEAAARKKELELPTAKELASDPVFLSAIAKAVVNTDGAVKNTFTGNPANTDVAVATALEYLGSRSKKAEDALAKIQASLDALTARFPEQPPAA